MEHAIMCHFLYFCTVSCSPQDRCSAVGFGSLRGCGEKNVGLELHHSNVPMASCSINQGSGWVAKIGLNCLNPSVNAV